MKVLRTALLSTLLIICFAHISHAQLVLNGGGGASACDETLLGVVGGSMEYQGDGEVKLVYDATVTNRCGDAAGYTEVVCAGVVIYSQQFGNGTFPVNTVVKLPILIPANGITVEIECTACEGNICHREGGVVNVDTP